MNKPECVNPTPKGMPIGDSKSQPWNFYQAKKEPTVVGKWTDSRFSKLLNKAMEDIDHEQ